MIIFIIDTSEKDLSATTYMLLLEILHHQDSLGKPVAVLYNKIDKCSNEQVLLYENTIDLDEIAQIRDTLYLKTLDNEKLFKKIDINNINLISKFYGDLVNSYETASEILKWIEVVLSFE